MPIKSEHMRQIREIARDNYGEDVRVVLFGSRVDNNAKGGDIDLLIESAEKNRMNFENRIKFLTALKLAIGDQKIDVVYNKRENFGMNITSTALKTGVEL